MSVRLVCLVNLRGRSSAGRAPALQAGGRRFEPDRLHQAPLGVDLMIGRADGSVVVKIRVR